VQGVATEAVRGGAVPFIELGHGCGGWWVDGEIWTVRGVRGKSGTYTGEQARREAVASH
jgi:hypothetical protein